MLKESAQYFNLISNSAYRVHIGGIDIFYLISLSSVLPKKKILRYITKIKETKKKFYHGLPSKHRRKKLEFIPRIQ